MGPRKANQRRRGGGADPLPPAGAAPCAGPAPTGAPSKSPRLLQLLAGVASLRGPSYRQGGKTQRLPSDCLERCWKGVTLSAEGRGVGVCGGGGQTRWGRESSFYFQTELFHSCIFCLCWEGQDSEDRLSLEIENSLTLPEYTAWSCELASPVPVRISASPACLTCLPSHNSVELCSGCRVAGQLAVLVFVLEAEGSATIVSSQLPALNRLAETPCPAERGERGGW